MLLANPNEIKQFNFTTPGYLRKPMSVFAYAPYCAKHMNDETNGDIYKELLADMLENNPYAVPFYYIGALRTISKSSSAKTCKEFLKIMCIDLDHIIPWYRQEAHILNPEFIDGLKDSMINYIKTFIESIRSQQRMSGLTESLIVDYSPLIPYTSTIRREDESSAGNPDYSTALERAISTYSELYRSDIAKYTILSNIALNNTNSIIDNIDIIFNNWKCPMDIFESFSHTYVNSDTPIVCDAEMNTLAYLMYVWLLNQGIPLKPEELLTQYNDYKEIKSHKMIPLKEDQFEALFESMCTYNTGDINDMMTVEAWTALSEDSQAYANKFLEHSSKHLSDEVYDLNALLAQFYSMRHIETNEYTNQFFISEFPGITINNYNYINNSIMVCEINEKYLAIPYVDIACDYDVRVITIDKKNKIQIWDNIDLEKFSGNSK